METRWGDARQALVGGGAVFCRFCPYIFMWRTIEIDRFLRVKFY